MTATSTLETSHKITSDHWRRSSWVLLCTHGSVMATCHGCETKTCDATQTLTSYRSPWTYSRELLDAGLSIEHIHDHLDFGVYHLPLWVSNDNMLKKSFFRCGGLQAAPRSIDGLARVWCGGGYGAVTSKRCKHSESKPLDTWCAFGQDRLAALSKVAQRLMLKILLSIGKKNMQTGVENDFHVNYTTADSRSLRH